MRNALLDRMIRIYGFENPIVIDFAIKVDDPKYPIENLEKIVKANENFPIINSEENF